MLLLWAALSGLAFGRLEATVASDQTAVVELSYRLELGSDLPADAVLSLTVLELRGGEVLDLEANGERLTLDRSTAPKLRARVTLPLPSDTLVLRYRTPGPTIPVVVPELIPDEAVANAFVATVSLADGWHLVESFPSGMAVTPKGYHLQLPVTPAYLALTLVDEEPFLTLPQTLDAAAVAFFLAVGALFYQRRGSSR